MTFGRFAAIVIGGSAGALEALGAILPSLPAGFALPVAIVLHVPPARTNHLAKVLGARCALDVREAEDKERLEPATVYIAPADYHLLVESIVEGHGRLSLSADDPVRFSRPSIDVLFESAADAYGPALVGVLLSGANDDGARGLARIKATGGTTVVQSPLTCTSRQMPLAALELEAADHVLTLGEIGPFLVRLCETRTAQKETA
jgi:two-component system chemotaxis response regulator CheB